MQARRAGGPPQDGRLPQPVLHGRPVHDEHALQVQCAQDCRRARRVQILRPRGPLDAASQSLPGRGGGGAAGPAVAPALPSSVRRELVARASR
eukprot:8589943-Pyramimonas_sp.AAC.1